MIDLAPTFEGLITGTLTEVGMNIETSVQELSAMAAERSAHLAASVGQPGFERAVQAERDTLALRAGITSVSQASSAQQRLLGVLQAGLTLGAKILAS